MKHKGREGVDPHGVKFISFEMPYEPDEAEIEFEFTVPGGEEAVAKVTNSKGLLGIIILFEPE